MWGYREEEGKNNKNLNKKLTKTSMEATKKFFFYSLFGSLFLFFSIIFLFYIIGSTNNEILQYNLINNIINKSQFNSTSNSIELSFDLWSNIGRLKLEEKYKYLLIILWFCIFIPFLIKIPIFPFHLLVTISSCRSKYNRFNIISSNNIKNRNIWNIKIYYRNI